MSLSWEEKSNSENFVFKNNLQFSKNKKLHIFKLITELKSSNRLLIKLNRSPSNHTKKNFFPFQINVS